MTKKPTSPYLKCSLSSRQYKKRKYLFCRIPPCCAAGWNFSRRKSGVVFHRCHTIKTELVPLLGIDNNVAVALKFVDKGEAVTTTYYYVIMNPNADLSAVEEYIIF